jgi:hypothetical protein
MRHLVFFIFVLPALFAVNAQYAVPVYAMDARAKMIIPQTKGDNRLVGVWEIEQRTKGGLGTIYEFREDGGWVGTIGALIDQKGDPPGPASYPPTSENPNEPAQKIMDGPEGSAAVVGVWKYRAYNVMAYERIMPDGQRKLRIPFPARWGTYEVRGKKLWLCEPACPPAVVNYRIINDTVLEIINPKTRKRLLLKRVQPTWYHALTETEVEEAKTHFLKAEEELNKKQQNTDTQSQTLRPTVYGIQNSDNQPQTEGPTDYEILR